MQYIADLIRVSPADLSEAATHPMSILISNFLSEHQNPHTVRSYRVGINQFLEFLEHTATNYLAPEWCPLVEQDKSNKSSFWIYRPPSGILILVTEEILENYVEWRMVQGDSGRTIAL